LALQRRDDVTLAELLRHPLYPFANFRTDAMAFSLLASFWAEVAREALGDEPFAACEPLQPPDRDIEGWGDPVMLDVWIPSLRRGARVLLLEAIVPTAAHRPSVGKLAEPHSIYVYLSRRGVAGPHDQIDQICFRADMTAASRAVVQRYMRAFLIDRVDVDSIEQSLRRFEEKIAVGPPS
jgi:hypothetical protein